MTRPLRFLLVDDDRAFLAALGAALGRRGHNVVSACDVSSGKSEAIAWEPDVAIVDLRMPGESGLELVRYLKRERPDLTTLVLTGYGSIATAVEATKLGAVQYLTKPVSVEDILRAVMGEPPRGDEAPTSSLDDVTWEHIQRVLTECQGNVSEAARRLKMHRRTLQRKLARGR